MNLPEYSPVIQSLLSEHDLNGLVAALRSPADAGLRVQAARALGEMGDIDATESLIRSMLEDPETAVQAAARRALQEMHGNQSELVIASYRSGPPEMDEWLVEPEEDFDPPAENADIDGLLLVVSHESNPAIREKAIRALAHINDTRSTDLLVYLYLHSQEQSTRAAAYEVLQAHFGDQADDIIQAVQNAARGEVDEWSDVDTADLLAWEEEDDDEEVEEGDEDLEEDLAGDELEPAGTWGRSATGHRPENFPQVPPIHSQDQGGPVMQEIGIPWRLLVIVGIAVLILAALLLLKP